MRVLLVGSAGAACAQLEASLRAAGHEVEVDGGGRDVALVLNERKPELVVAFVGPHAPTNQVIALASAQAIPCVTCPDGIAGGSALDRLLALSGARSSTDQAREVRAQRLLSSLAHEFNNTLTTVLTCAGALVEAPAPRDAKELLAELEQGAERAQVVAKRLVALARGRAEAPRPLSLEPFLHELPAALRGALPSDVVLCVQPAETPELRVPAASGALLQCVFQLVSWCLAGRQDGEVRVLAQALGHRQLGRFETSEGTLTDGDYALITVELASANPASPAPIDELLRADVRSLQAALCCERTEQGGRRAKLFLPCAP